MKKGFTLAEVLITLAIIGVVAALTIPSVILNTNQTEYKSALKKSVSVLNQAVSLRLATENDSPSAMTTSGAVSGLFAGQMNTVNSAASNCTALTANIADGTAATTSNMGCYFTTTDGMQFWLLGALPAGVGKVCKSADTNPAPATTVSGSSDACPTGTTAATTYPTASCTDTAPCLMMIDVNGEKNPNVTTSSADTPQDRFAVLIAGENGTSILPAGVAADIMYK